MKKITEIAAAAFALGITVTTFASYEISLVEPPAIGYHVLDGSLKLDDAGGIFGNVQFPNSAAGTDFSEVGDVTVLGRQLSNGYFQSFSGVSQNGIIAGSIPTVNGLSEGFEQSGNTPTVLTGPKGMVVSAVAVNDSGETIGVSANPSNVSFDYAAMIWQQGKATQIKVSVGTGPQSDGVLAINDNGTVAGYDLQISTSFATAFTWNNGKATILPSLGGSSIANDINSAGVVAGTSMSKAGERYAVEWTGGKIIQLVSSSGYKDSDAVAINDSGEIVGSDTSSAGTRSAFVYENGKMSSLDSLMPASDGYHFLEAFDVNNSGEILAQATFQGKTQDVLLTPNLANPSASIVAEIATLSGLSPTTLSPTTSVPEPSIAAILVFIVSTKMLRRRSLCQSSKIL